MPVFSARRRSTLHFVSLCCDGKEVCVFCAHKPSCVKAVFHQHFFLLINSSVFSLHYLYHCASNRGLLWADKISDSWVWMCVDGRRISAVQYGRAGHWQCSCSITGSVCHRVIRHHCSLSLSPSLTRAFMLNITLKNAKLCWAVMRRAMRSAGVLSFFSVNEGVCNLQG